MQCSNCGARIPGDLGACPECGVFARVVGPPTRSKSRTWILALLLAAAAVAGVTYFATKPRPGERRPLPPIRVVKDRPGGARVGAGAAISEPEAVLRLQRSFAGVKPECVSTISKGYHEGAYVIEAVDRCAGTRLGKYRVDGKTGAIGGR